MPHTVAQAFGPLQPVCARRFCSRSIRSERFLYMFQEAITRPRCAIALLGLGLLAACSDVAPVDLATEEIQASWTEYPGTPTFAAGWALRQVFAGNADVWDPSRAGAFVRGSSGWAYAFPRLEDGAILGVTSGSSNPTQVDLVASNLLGRFFGGATTSRGPAVLYDRNHWRFSSYESDAMRLARLTPRGWTSELVGTTFASTVLTGTCLVNRGDRLVALYHKGFEALTLAEERSAGGWDVQTLAGDKAAWAGPFGCAGGTSDVWFVLGEDAFSPSQVVRLHAGDVTLSEVTPLPIGPRLRAASTAVGPDDLPVVAYIDDSAVRLATRTAAGTWNIEVVPTPFNASEVGKQNIALSLVSGSPVLAITRLGNHPTLPGVGKDEIWLLRQVEGAWRATEVYSPPGGWLRIHGMVVDSGRAVLGLVHSQYAGPYRDLIVEGPLP